jgi:hypothetical protein
MKRLGGIFGISLILVQLVSLLIVPKAGAENCSNFSSYGAIRLFLPEVSTKKDYALWFRLQPTDTPAQVLVEVNQNDCLEVTGENQPAYQWYWQPYKKDGTIQALRFTQEEGNTLRIIGILPGVKLDKVMLTEPDCIPQEFGTNCKNLEAVGIESGVVTNITPLSNDPVSGKVTLSLTPQIVGSELSAVHYVAEGKTLQTVFKAEPFDTTLLSNGKHTVQIETVLSDGRVIREATVIEVNNLENALSPIVRWIRLNLRTLYLTGLVIAGIIILLLLISWVRKWFLKRRQLHQHGF